MSVCCSAFPNCACTTPAAYQPPALRVSKGCIVVLKTGERVEMEGITATRIKHMRRTGGVIPMQGEDGTRRVIEARLIRQIYPIY